ncbi:hypothetical protein B0T10DRAFT_32953 [Thelonectria olida]|uniref:N-acetyltransferase domain-containing protein n=1 Tax=Thelonectria olida TaxID=1576542 RepID=A0A9P8WJ77_9HYPO|nr:hypothetical protein B0T10DRAFT_32953 [Thelonectria olida]
MPSAIATENKVAHLSLPPCKVSPACHHDVPALVDIYLAAFRDDFDATIVMGTSRECWVRDLLDFISDPSVHLLKATKKLDGSEAILGWALWTPHADVDSDTESSGSTSDSDLDTDEWSSGEESGNGNFCMFDRLNTTPSQHHEPGDGSEDVDSWPHHCRPHWHLHVIAISPEYQNQGVEAQLLEQILILADEIESTVSTEVSPLSAPLYRGFGFDDEGSVGFTTKTGLEHHLIMARPPDVHERLKLGVGRGYY